MKVSAATIGFAGIVCAALLIAYRVAEPRQLVTEADDQTALWEGMATNQALELTVIAPTSTRFPSPVPTRKPKPPTETPHPTYGTGAKPGLHIVPAWTPTVAPAMTVELTYPPCDVVTPRPYADVYCEVI